MTNGFHLFIERMDLVLWVKHRRRNILCAVTVSICTWTELETRKSFFFSWNYALVKLSSPSGWGVYLWYMYNIPHILVYKCGMCIKWYYACLLISDWLADQFLYLGSYYNKWCEAFRAWERNIYIPTICDGYYKQWLNPLAKTRHQNWKWLHWGKCYFF